MAECTVGLNYRPGLGLDFTVTYRVIGLGLGFIITVRIGFRVMFMVSF